MKLIAKHKWLIALEVLCLLSYTAGAVLDLFYDDWFVFIIEWGVCTISIGIFAMKIGELKCNELFK